ncbi:unnamed protein product, partial [marine sediment metagenome]
LSQTAAMIGHQTISRIFSDAAGQNLIGIYTPTDKVNGNNFEFYVNTKTNAVVDINGAAQRGNTYTFTEGSIEKRAAKGSLGEHYTQDNKFELTALGNGLSDSLKSELSQTAAMIGHQTIGRIFSDAAGQNLIGIYTPTDKVNGNNFEFYVNTKTNAVVDINGAAQRGNTYTFTEGSIEKRAAKGSLGEHYTQDNKFELTALGNGLSDSLKSELSQTAAMIGHQTIGRIFSDAAGQNLIGIYTPTD